MSKINFIIELPLVRVGIDARTAVRDLIVHGITISN